MSKFRIDDSPTAVDRDAAPLLVVDADTPLAALDAYAEGQGFAPYSLIDEGEAEGWYYTMADGRMGAVFTNYEIFATEVI